MARSVSTPDLTRIAEALSRPGIDPRAWILTGVVEDFAVDDEYGPLADVTLLPYEITVTARVASWYAGAGFGAYTPINVNDEVLVSFVGGALDTGAVIIGRLWSASDVPPEDSYDGDTESSDVLLRVDSDKTLRLIVSGSGNVVVTAEGTGQIMLGGEEALSGTAGLLKGAVQGEAVDTFTGQTFATLGQASSKVRVEK